MRDLYPIPAQRDGEGDFDVSLHAAIGSTGDVYIATANNSNQITGGWSGPYSCSNYEASFYPGFMYVNGLHVAVIVVTGTTPPASQIGYTINSTANDHMDVATVQTLL